MAAAQIKPKDIALSKVDAPGSAVMESAARIRRNSHGCFPSTSAIGPLRDQPVSDWKYMFNPSGTKFATRVGMPMPRLTSIPG